MIEITVRGLKKKTERELQSMLDELETDWRLIKREIEYKIRRQLATRQNSKTITVWFHCKWSGYRSSQSRVVQVTKRRISKALYNQMPPSFTSRFTDGTYNFWTVSDSPSKEISNTYNFQIDEFLDKQEQKMKGE